MSQDIGIDHLLDRSTGVHTSSGNHSHAGRLLPVGGGPPLRRLAGLDQPADDPLRRGGEAAFRPRSRRPRSNPRAISLDLEDRIIRFRKDLSKRGLDAGAETIRSHLIIAGASRVPSSSTIWRVLTRRGSVTPQPRKRPKVAGQRICAEQPNERWQADTSHWALADGTGVEIRNIIDVHSQLNLWSSARTNITGPDVLAGFRSAFRRHGIPASMLTDNGAGPSPRFQPTTACAATGSTTAE